MEKPNCYECKHNGGEVPGSCHICCKHPSLGELADNPLLQVLGIFASVGRSPPLIIKNEKFAVKGDPHGIRKGWFNFPFNYDPIWLLECNGYEARAEEVNRG